MAKRAFLSASASHRWINCPPAAKLYEGIKDESSPYAQEGTDCHELCVYLVEKVLGRTYHSSCKIYLRTTWTILQLPESLSELVTMIP